MNTTNPTPTLDPEILGQWLGNSRVTTDTIDARPANFLRATLDRNTDLLHDGDALPPGFHWLYFQEASNMSNLGRDGHPALGGFLPPVALPRRMWAGTRITFHDQLNIGTTLVRTSRVERVERKTGRSGELCFVTVRHSVTHKEALVLEEEHDVVYREEQSSGIGSDPTPAPDPSDITRVVDPSPVLLFRYSALTFNGHRIHYDADYCRQVEGYPGLVVHAPLAATLMLDLAAEYGEQSGESRAIRQFRQKSVSPLFSPDPFSIHLSEQQSNWEMWAANPDGNLASRATLVLD